MLTDFISFVSEIFPSVDPETAARCLRQISRGEVDPASLFRPAPFDYLAQGDIVEPVRFLTTDDSGHELEYSGPGLLISNSCDAEREEHVSFAACYPVGPFLAGNVVEERTLRSNCIFHLLHLPLVGADDRGLVVDLTLLQSHSRTFVSNDLLGGATKKLCSLSQWGFYLFLAKLSVHLMRPEAADVGRSAKAQ